MTDNNRREPAEIPKVRSEVVKLETFTVAADPQSRANGRDWYKDAVAINKKRIAERIRLANGKKIVRTSNFGIQCSWEGLLIRETPQFFFFAEGCFVDGEKVDKERIRRVSKKKAHLEPCRGCVDHPQTNHPLG